MLASVLLATLATTPLKPVDFHLTCCSPQEPQTKVERLVAEAWQEAGSPQEQDEKSKQEQRHKEDLKRDIELGREYSAQVDKELKASKNEEFIKRLNKVGVDIASIANRRAVEVTWGDKRLNQFEYTFKVVEGEDVNAFSIPGGYLYFYEGMMKYCETDDELAGVMAHEIAHASFRHIATLQAENKKFELPTLLAVLVVILTGGGEGSTAALQGVSMANAAFVSGWSVKAEQAADFGGLQYMLDTGYDPTGMVTLMERLSRDEKTRPQIDWGIYRTHPPGRERVEKLTSAMKQMGIELRRSKVTTSFRTQIKPGDGGLIEAWFDGKRLYTFAGEDALKRADAAAERLNSFFDTVPALVMVKRDGEVILGGSKPLIKVTNEDAKALKSDPDQLAASTEKAIKAALYSLAYQVQDARR